MSPRRILFPPVAAFLLVSAYVIAESLGFAGLEQPQGDTVAEAAALGHAARTLQLIAEGQNPNQPSHIRSGFLDSGEYELTPLEAAILARHVELVRLLLRMGDARFDTSSAVCFARARLPEALPDLGASRSQAASDAPLEIGAAIGMCAAKRPA